MCILFIKFPLSISPSGKILVEIKHMKLYPLVDADTYSGYKHRNSGI